MSNNREAAPSPGNSPHSRALLEASLAAVSVTAPKDDLAWAGQELDASAEHWAILLRTATGTLESADMFGAREHA